MKPKSSLHNEQEKKKENLTDIEGRLAAQRKQGFRRRIGCWRGPKFVTWEDHRAPVGFCRKCYYFAITFKKTKI